jgi:hypothetical protein
LYLGDYTCFGNCQGPSCTVNPANQIELIDYMIFRCWCEEECVGGNEEIETYFVALPQCHCP